MGKGNIRAKGKSEVCLSFSFFILFPAEVRSFSAFSAFPRVRLGVGFPVTLTRARGKGRKWELALQKAKRLWHIPSTLPAGWRDLI